MCCFVKFIKPLQQKDPSNIQVFSPYIMLYDQLYGYPSDLAPYSSLPNIHPQSIDCIVRSQLPTKGSLYVSNLEAVQNTQILKKLKVSCIFTCAQGYKLDYSSTEIANYKYFPLPENPIFSLSDYFTKANSFLQEALSKQNCIVHCLTGQSKSMAVIIAYLIEKYNMNFEDSLSYAKRKRKLVNLDERFVVSLKQFEKHIKDKNLTKSNLSKIHTMAYKTQNSQIDASQNQSKISETPQKPGSRQASMSSNREKFPTQQSKQISRNENSKNMSKYPEIDSIIKEDSLQNPSNSRLITLHVPEKNKTQQSQIKTDNKSKHQSFSVDHKEAIPFQNIRSSLHQGYIGVKRDFKNPSTSFKKQNGSMINFSSKPQPSSLLNAEINSDLLHVTKQLSKSRVSERGSNISQTSPIKRDKSRIHSEAIERQSRTKTNKTEMDLFNPSHMRILNPQNEQANIYALKDDKKSNSNMKNKRSVSSLNASQIQYRNNTNMRTQNSKFQLTKILSQPFEISPSKIDYFSSVNEELNLKVKQISTTYQSQITDLRVQYQNRLRQIRKPDNSSIISVNASPIA